MGATTPPLPLVTTGYAARAIRGGVSTDLLTPDACLGSGRDDTGHGLLLGCREGAQAEPQKRGHREQRQER